MKKQILMLGALICSSVLANAQAFVGTNASSTYLDFGINSASKGRLSSGGNFIFGSSLTDNSTGVVQVQGTTAMYGDLDFRHSGGGGRYIMWNGSTNTSLHVTGNDNWTLSASGSGTFYPGLKVQNTSYSSSWFNTIGPNYLAITAEGMGNQFKYVNFNGAGSGLSKYIQFGCEGGSSNGVSVKIVAQNGNHPDGFTGGSVILNAGAGSSSTSGGAIYLNTGSTSCTSCNNGYVFIGNSTTPTKVGINLAGNPSYELDINGDLNVSGDAYCTANGWSGSDARFKKNISEIKDITNELFRIISTSYDFRKDEFKERKFNDKHQFGFIAQDVEKIFPNLTTRDAKGYYAINYQGFIPLLLQALKEEDQKIKELEAKIAGKGNEIQNAKLQELENKLAASDIAKNAEIAALTSKLAELQNALNACCQANTNKTNNSNPSDIQSTLDQNVPNPFSGETVIGFSIAASYTKAFIGIYDMNGREIKKIAISDNMKQVTIAQGLLLPGMYTYSLVVDNNLIDTKKMVVVE